MVEGDGLYWERRDGYGTASSHWWKETDCAGSGVMDTEWRVLIGGGDGLYWEWRDGYGVARSHWWKETDCTGSGVMDTERRLLIGGRRRIVLGVA